MRILVTAGPTREFIDPVRFISNRSSGKMGYAVAIAARNRGHEVVLVSGPVNLPPPHAVKVVFVTTAADMLSAVEAQVEWCEVLIMAAAVADWRPAVVAVRKLKKRAPLSTLQLEPTPDILSTLRSRKGSRTFVGFAAETHDLLDEARRKLSAKGLDAVVANDVSRADAGFDVETNQITLVTAEGMTQSLPLMGKSEVAGHIIQWVEERRGCSVSRRMVAAAEAGGLTGESRLARQLAFLREIDKLKSVYRRTLLLDGSRYENDAEHSWHLALMAILLKEYANDPSLDIARVVKMVLVHDVVEIDAGDTYCYDDQANCDKAVREAAAASRLFALLPEDQSGEIRAMWDEFEARETPESRFAAALDRLQPLMHNYFTGGQIWKKHGVASEKVRDRNRHIAEGAGRLWVYAETLIESAVQRGFLDP